MNVLIPSFIDLLLLLLLFYIFKNVEIPSKLILSENLIMSIGKYTDFPPNITIHYCNTATSFSPFIGPSSDCHIKS
jgi:hypothetical protein